MACPLHPTFHTASQVVDRSYSAYGTAQRLGFPQIPPTALVGFGETEPAAYADANPARLPNPTNGWCIVHTRPTTASFAPLGAREARERGNKKGKAAGFLVGWV